MHFLTFELLFSFSLNRFVLLKEAGADMVIDFKEIKFKEGEMYGSIFPITELESFVEEIDGCLNVKVFIEQFKYIF